MTPAGRVGATVDVAVAAWRTWRAPGLARRALYEASRRSGRLTRDEDRWLALGTARAPLRPVGVAAPESVTDPGPAVEPDQASSTPALEPRRTGGQDPGPSADAPGIEVYGGLHLPAAVPPDWHRHPLTGVEHSAAAHWSCFSDARPEEGDVKDMWELGRLGWLQPHLRRWAATGDDSDAETIWRVIEDWVDHNPPYLGPQWMCGQEASLRAITAVLLADALRSSPASTPERHLLVAHLVRVSVGRVAPTLGYALSQRNNHATSEAGFLWTAAVLAPDLPDASGIRRRAARALSEAVRDQVGPDGAYSQHSPSYHRVALHVLLWVLAVARARGTAPPPGVDDAVARSVPHLRSLIAPGAGGRVPALGNIDGALVWALTPCPIDDMRPVVAHAAAATGQPSGLDPGPWDEEAGWFGLAPTTGPPRRGSPSIATHALTRGRAHAVVRAGPLRHRPAHADQLHVDVWLDGENVARDPGSYRYTAPDPWGNALAGEEVHDVPRRAGAPQALRSGRFFWSRWTEAVVEARAATDDAAGLLARLDLPGGPLRRIVIVADGIVAVLDDPAGAPAVVRWNLPADVDVTASDGRTTVVADRWTAVLLHGGTARRLDPVDDDPTAGWWSPGYGRRETLTALEVDLSARAPTVALFAADGPSAASRADEARAVLGTRFERDGLRSLLDAIPVEPT